MERGLNAYNRKRSFERTPEPEGTSETAGEGLRFAVQRHMARKDHYDLRLEWAGALLSWAVPKGPSFDTRDKRLAVRVEEHPLEYRNFEGTIPAGEYGGGAVMLWDEGFWAPRGDVEAGLRDGMLKFALNGRRLRGGWALVRPKAREGETKDNWLLLKEKDGHAQSSDGISAFTTSIRTGRTMAEIEAGKDEALKKNPFEQAAVQLAKLVDAIPAGGDWVYELKYDGYRMLAFVEGNRARLITRNGHDYTARFRAAVSSLLDVACGRAMVLDGEMTVADEQGRTDFQALQGYLRNHGAHGLTYMLFDLLALDGEDLRARPLAERKEALEALLRDAPRNLRYSRHVTGNGEQCFEAACAMGMEGIVGKRAGSPYTGARNGDWVKRKCDRRREFVIGGYTLSDKRASGVSSLLLGYYDGGGLVFAGRAGTGMGEAEMRGLEAEFAGLKRPESPFRAPPPLRPGERVTWLSPELVAEIKFAEVTSDGLLRQAVFKGLREGRDPRDVTMEEEADGEREEPPPQIAEEAPMGTDGSGIVVEGVKVTNPGKVIYPEPAVTKEDVARYYATVAGRMLPHVRRRILSIVRCPKGISQTCFYKKHPGPESRGVVTVQVQAGGGEAEEYFYIEDAAGLVTEAQMGTLEFHTWGSRADDLERPDVMVFDLDPDEGMELNTVRQGVRDMRGVLGELSLECFLKTSGGKGYHVVVPLMPGASWDAFRDFARRVAELMEARWPERYTSNVRKARRAGRIFIDWMRNARGATSIAPYSLRARKGAKVSMPISWEELDAVAPDGVGMGEAGRRINDVDPWEAFFRSEQGLRKSSQ